MRIEFERAGRDCAVEVEVGVNDHPEQLGCPGYARGFAYSRATITPPARGYADFLGWVQLVDSDLHPGGFHLDYFEPLGKVPHPFALYGFAPELFDAPHTDEANWDFLAHSFLCGLGDDTLDGSGEIDAILGFSWGFRKREGRVSISRPSRLGPQEWDRHGDYLREAYPAWTFLPGFGGRATEP
ncbi:MAG TPA: hypothetical protein VF125_08110 [Solirubrobacterales bacterium]